jgi:NAD-dependent DNA ligase
MLKDTRFKNLIDGICNTQITLIIMEKLVSKYNQHPRDTLQTLPVDDIASLYMYAMEAYHNTSTPVMSDELFDMLREHLQRVAPNHPVLKEVGAPIPDYDKILLPYWMGSLNKIRDDEKTIQKWQHEFPGDVVISDKLDGISALLSISTKPGSKSRTDWTNRKLYSRGNGVYGKDITHVLPFIKHIPDIRQDKSTGNEITVRGELIISKSNWESLKENGANARNVVSGSINRKVPDPKIAGNIDFVAYELVYPRMKMSDGLEFLKSKGFKVVHHTVHNPPVTIETLSSTLITRRATSPYEVDGIVVYQDQLHKVVKGKNPKYAFAFKSIHTHTEVEVIVSGVQWNVSKDSYIKPTVLFDTVELAGVKINKATGFNANYIDKNVIGHGSRIVIIRSGDVIPHIQRVLSPASTGKPSMPEIPYIWNDTHVDIIATSKGSIDVMKKTVEHFVKKMDMKGIGPGVISKILDAKKNVLIDSSVHKDKEPWDAIPVFMNITKEELLEIPGFQAKTADMILNAINDVKKRIIEDSTAMCTEIMIASNIFGRGLGDKKIRTIVGSHPEILSDRKLPAIETLANIDGIGELTAKSFINGTKSYFSLIDKMGITCNPLDVKSKNSTKSTSSQNNKNDKNKSHRFTDMVIVFTGIRNKEWEKIIIAEEGKITFAVSKNTTLVVALNANDGTGKIKKAVDLGIKIMDVDEFAARFKLKLSYFR